MDYLDWAGRGSGVRLDGFSLLFSMRFAFVSSVLISIHRDLFVNIRMEVSHRLPL